MSKHYNLDPRIFRQNGQYATCLVCPGSSQGSLRMLAKHAAKHSVTCKHRRHTSRVLSQLNSRSPLLSDQVHLSASSSNHEPAAELEQSAVTEDCENQPYQDNSGFNMEISDAIADASDIPSLPISDLWDITDRTFSAGESADYYQEIVDSLERGDFHFTCTDPIGQELPVEFDDANEDEFTGGKDITGVSFNHSNKSVDTGPSHPTYPWPSIPMFLTDLLFSSPRLRFSEAQKKAVLNWGKQLHATDVPSMSGLKKCQARIRELIGDPTEKVMAASGNIFYMNDIAKAIAKDFANPLTRFCMQDYPEDAGQGMSQVFHGEKMLLGSESMVCPTVRVNGNIYFVNELLRLISGEYFIPERFFYSRHGGNRDLYALGRDVKLSEAGFVVVDERVTVPTSAFSQTFEQVSASDLYLLNRFSDCSTSFAAKMPHPLRAKARGRMVYSVPLIIFMDDVSGNISKQWNKHYVIYMSNASLPREMIEKEFCVRFVTASPHAAPMELMKAMKDSIAKAAETGVDAWDCKHNEEALLAPYPLFFGGDNPMQAEECSHAGLNCNYFCRTCKVGGPKEFKASDEGFTQIFRPCEPRTPEDTAAQIRHQLSLAVLPGGSEKIKKSTADTGIRDTLTDAIVKSVLEIGKNLRKRAPGKQVLSENAIQAQLSQELERLLQDVDINPLIGIPSVDIHMDTPTEILHTILLGIVKYFWGQTMWLLEKSKLTSIFQTRLASVKTGGLNVPAINAEYICRYSGGLIGKHFKCLAQLMSFLIYDLVPPVVLDAWNAIGALVVLLWHTQIHNTEGYLASLSRAIEDFLNLTARCAPSILLSKPKFHFLVHLPAYIRRFGPAIIFSTERYESFNHVFRLASIYSNRQAPSHDTCVTFASQDAIKHAVTGGYWFDHRPGIEKWVHAGDGILEHMESHPELLSFIGLSICDERIEAGRMKFSGGRGSTDPDSSAGDIVSWSSTECSRIAGSLPSFSHAYHPSAQFRCARSLVTRVGDNVSVRSHVLYEDNDKLLLGVIVEMVSSVANPDTTSFVAVCKMDFLPERHLQLRVPCVKLLSENIILQPKAIFCAVNVLHDCSAGNCTIVQEARTWQERHETSKARKTVSHSETNQYVLNVYSLHNYEHILRAMPEHLRASAFPATSQAEELQLRKDAAFQVRHKRDAQKARKDPDVVGNPSTQDDDPRLEATSQPVFDNPKPQGTVKNKPAQKKKNIEASHQTSTLSSEPIASQSTAVQPVVQQIPYYYAPSAPPPVMHQIPYHYIPSSDPPPPPPLVGMPPPYHPYFQPIPFLGPPGPPAPFFPHNLAFVPPGSPFQDQYGNVYYPQ